MSRFDLRGKTAVVTGAASGIGLALAHALGARGCHLILADINLAELEIKTSPLADKVRIHLAYCDVGDAQSITHFVEEIEARDMPVDLLFNNAGVAIGGLFDDVPAAEFERLIDINFLGVVRMTRALLPHLRQRPDARIINISSLFGLIAPSGQTAYSASKFAVRGFSNALRHELLSSSVGVTVVYPGGVRTQIAKRAPNYLKLGESEQAALRKRTEQALRMPPEEAARQILSAVERRCARVVIGMDAKVLGLLERLLPVSYWRVIGKLFG